MTALWTQAGIKTPTSASTASCVSAAAGRSALQKIPQSSDFDDLFGGQYGRNKLRLRSGMYLVEMTLARRLRQKRPDAVVQNAVNDKIGIGPR
jgi:hypothetical protein